MRVLTVEQPFAQLIVRGVMPFIPRQWVTPHLGRIAIHAKQVAPSHGIFRLAIEHPRLARTLASQGWTSRDHLIALPRGAIVGTVELKSVRAVREVLLDPARADLSPDDRLDITAAGGDGRHDPDAFVAPVWPDDYLWMFANAIEIEPIGGVTGRQNLWQLSDDQARALAAAERDAREAALTAAAARGSEGAKPQTRRRAHEWLAEIEAERRAHEAKRAAETTRAGREVERDLRWFARDRFERLFDRTVARYFAAYPLRTADGEDQVRIVGPFFQSLFPGASWVTRLEFERRVRVHFREVTRAKTRPRVPRPPLWDLPWHLPRLARVVEIGLAAGIHIRVRGRGTDAARRARLRAVDGEMPVQRQREDPHDPPDPREFRGS